MFAAEEKRLIRWLLVATVAGALLLVLLVHLGLPLPLILAITTKHLPVL